MGRAVQAGDAAPRPPGHSGCPGARGPGSGGCHSPEGRCRRHSRARVGAPAWHTSRAARQLCPAGCWRGRPHRSCCVPVFAAGGGRDGSSGGRRVPPPRDPARACRCSRQAAPGEPGRYRGGRQRRGCGCGCGGGDSSSGGGGSGQRHGGTACRAACRATAKDGARHRPGHIPPGCALFAMLQQPKELCSAMLLAGGRLLCLPVFPVIPVGGTHLLSTKGSHEPECKR